MINKFNDEPCTVVVSRTIQYAFVVSPVLKVAFLLSLPS